MKTAHIIAPLALALVGLASPAQAAPPDPTGGKFTIEEATKGLAGKGTLPCPRMVIAWKRALLERPPETFAALTVPLSIAIKRCPAPFDPMIAEILNGAPSTRATVVMAIDPFGSETTEMPLTCKMLGPVSRSGESPRVRERAEDALSHSCQNVKLHPPK